MTEEIVSADASAQETDAPTPLEKELGNTPGVGLTLEQIRSVVAKAHDVMLPKDDATLIIATILNAHLTEVDKLQTRHEAGLSRLMGDKTDEYVKGVKEAVSLLSESLSSASVEGIKAIFNEHDSRLKAFKSNLSWLAAITACSAIINVIAFVLMGLR